MIIISHIINKSVQLVVQLDLFSIIDVGLVLLVYLAHVQSLSMSIELLYLLAVSSLIEDQLELQTLERIVWSKVFLWIRVMRRGRKYDI